MSRLIGSLKIDINYTNKFWIGLLMTTKEAIWMVKKMIRFFDYLISLMGLIILMPLLILIWIIGLIENGSLYLNKRG